MMVSVKIVSTGYGSLKITSLLFPITKEGKVVSTIGEIVQDGKLLIKKCSNSEIKGLKDGTIYIEVYAKESLFSDLPTKNGHNYLNMYVREGSLFDL